MGSEAKQGEEVEKPKNHHDHNVRQIKAALFRKEMSLKGTAPSFLNLESDKEKPGPVSTLSAKGYDHLEALIRTEDNSDVDRQELGGYQRSLLKIRHALAHVRRTKFDHYRAILHIENDPGIVKRWEQGSEVDSERWLYSYEKACEEAALYVQAMWPGTRLYVPMKAEERPAETRYQAAAYDREEAGRGSMARSHHIRYHDLLRIEERYPGITREAAKAMWSEERKPAPGSSVPTIERSIRFCEKHEWPCSGEPVEERFRWTGLGPEGDLRHQAG